MIANYGLIAKPLYEKLKGKDVDIFGWNSEHKGAFQESKKQLLQAPALALPDLAKHFDLYIYERSEITFGVLAQKLGPLTQLVAYFSKQLDQITKEWPPCLQAVAATTTLKEAEELMFGEPVTIWTSHQVQALVIPKGTEWLSPGIHPFP